MVCARRVRVGYGGKYRVLADALKSAFPGQLEITGEGTPDATGAFEVNVMPAAGGSHLVHSKIGGGGHVVCSQPQHPPTTGDPPPLTPRPPRPRSTLSPGSQG